MLPGAPLDATTAFFTDALGFRIELISPADDPRTVVLSGHGTRLRLERDRSGDAGELRIERADGGPTTELTAPNGTHIVLAAPPHLDIPALEPALTSSRLAGAQWGEGRAGMRYRDLIPGRQGGRFIASHIHVPDGGPVPDYVHYHRVRFQMIYCYRGWVRVAYEDQGPPIVLDAGDCLVQPPLIRHRVLECSGDLHVIELACPALHDTYADHDLELPNEELRPERSFDGQRFTFHQAARATWTPWHLAGFEARDTGIGDATGGVAQVRVARVTEPDAVRAPADHDGELWFAFVLHGAMTVDVAGHEACSLEAGDAIAIPPNTAYAIAAASADLQLLVVDVPITA